ncbi:hypothetical protein BDP55DRAFT_639395 [Colletotrichum godetiae]|uniref:Transcription factor domain-containing protein n=1 Tax=Colletotrichum godetiae TaxID=1209918 RepID=A0AAJ0EML6_9PEZI|nr:uncharacterized protein BDP55DRAFT_639395 [Colletotrichum godetiae]KAK1656702.1 hypothetical protein BDP55DRAFT_639395 [Colletotrichum godetiae]
MAAPLISEPSNGVRVYGSQIFTDLDSYLGKAAGHQGTTFVLETPARTSTSDDLVVSILNTAKIAYAARWISFAISLSHMNQTQSEEFVRESWRTARRNMLKLLTRATCRSVLALYLFSQTPIPTGISEEEISDGISGVVCIHAALSQVQNLRDRRVGTHVSTEFLNLESRIYWAAIAWDTANSLVSNLRSSLTSGLKGACLEPVWIVVRAFLKSSFQPKIQRWRAGTLEDTDEVACSIFSGAAVGNLYFWKTITSLKEAVREGVDETTLQLTWKSLLDALNIWENSIRPLLETCQRRLNFLDPKHRLNWFQLSLEYWLGVLIVVDTLENAYRSDLIRQLTKLRQDAQCEIFNAIQYGLKTDYILPQFSEKCDLQSNGDVPACSTSLIGVYSFFPHLLTAVRLAQKAVERDYDGHRISRAVYCSLISILVEALGHLPPFSRGVQQAKIVISKNGKEFGSGLESSLNGSAS